MNSIITIMWTRWSAYLLIGILIRFLLDVIFSLLFRNYRLFQPFEDYLYTVLLTAVTLESLFYLRMVIGKRLPWDASPKRRFYVQWTLSLGVGFFFAFGVRWLVRLTLSSVYYVRVLDEMVILVMVFLSITLLMVTELGVFMLQKWRFSLAELERFKKENAEFQFESLRNQVNPHFLFNSLNTLSSLIYEDRDKAQAFTRELSDVYRYILENRGEELVVLERELAVARSYMYLLQLRFEKNLSIDVKVDESLSNYMIAPLTLQLLIENAVKHNVISRKKPLHIEICTKDTVLVVKNNLQRKEMNEYSSKLGLKNIRSRYAFLTEEPMEIIETDKEFTVKIPLIKGK